MELNLKTIRILINALVVAKETTQLRYSQQQIENRVMNTQPVSPVFLENQATMLGTIDDYDSILLQMRELESRACIQME